MLLDRCKVWEDRFRLLSHEDVRTVSLLDRIIKDGRVIKGYKTEIASLRANLEDAEAYGKAKREEQRDLMSRIGDLMSRIAELEQDRDLKDPLFQIGVATRVRYLEMAKKWTLGLPRSQLDSTCIENGNVAAHHAMGHVDAILFHGDILSPHIKANVMVPFTQLYRTIPGDHGLLSKKMAHVIDCEATLRTLNVLNEGQRPIAQRQQALDQSNFLYGKYAKLSKESFDADQDVDTRLARLIALTKEIVEEDRKSKR